MVDPGPGVGKAIWSMPGEGGHEGWQADGQGGMVAE